MSNKLTTEEFIQRSILKHGLKYDYSKTKYINNRTKVCIICPKHGEFWQTASSHINGSNCPKCTNHEKKTTEQFIEEARQVHGDKYDYSKVDYKNITSNILIKCNTCGSEFWQITNNHINQHQGCPNCYGTKQRTTEEFIEEAAKVHGDKYDYSLTDYTNIGKKVKIICPVHGVFEQIARDHLEGRGCNLCGGTAKSNIEEFTQSAIKIHGDRYDYSKAEYINNKSKVYIICAEHGEFWQRPNDHLNGCGCPDCAKSHGEEQIRLWLEKQGFVKDKTYFREYRFEDCRDELPLPFDFYIPSKNTVIEFQGKQHFVSVDIWCGEEAFEKRKLHDQIKRDYCKEKGITELEPNIKNIDLIMENWYNNLNENLKEKCQQGRI